MSLAVSLPKNAIVLPSNMKVQSLGGQLVFQRVKRRVKKFKTTAKQRARAAASQRRFKIPILTAFTFGPSVLLSASTAMRSSGLLEQLRVFTMEMISYYTGVRQLFGGQLVFDARRLAIGYGPLVAVGVVKTVAKGRVMALNRALSRMQIPASAS